MITLKEIQELGCATKILVTLYTFSLFFSSNLWRIWEMLKDHVQILEYWRTLEVFQLWHMQVMKYKHIHSIYKIKLFQNENVLHIYILRYSC